MQRKGSFVTYLSYTQTIGKNISSINKGQENRDTPY
ncbi:hypothetical protein Pint_22906 [Pistacia integerrima]|uniref:Uncharacterized protein n=1 Tax=Pistacia integerrima TaxID=434235 RepID=A0ACC0YJQ5_9ROSI|nr:hypothetical protein Pint_22906 [Pistacia integerrima]